MLNNKKELNALAEQVAQALIDAETKSRNSSTSRGKSDKGSISKQVKDSIHLKGFLRTLTDFMAKYPESSKILKNVKDRIINEKMPADLFPLFVTLIRFEYQYKKINS